MDRSTDQPTEQVTEGARDSFTHLKTGIPRNTKKSQNQTNQWIESAPFKPQVQTVNHPKSDLKYTSGQRVTDCVLDCVTIRDTQQFLTFWSQH